MYLRSGPALTNVCFDTLRYTLPFKLAIPPNHNILTRGQLVIALTKSRQATARIATKTFFFFLVSGRTGPGKGPMGKAEFKSGSAILQVDVFPLADQCGKEKLPQKELCPWQPMRCFTMSRGDLRLERKAVSERALSLATRAVFHNVSWRSETGKKSCLRKSFVLGNQCGVSQCLVEI